MGDEYHRGGSRPPPARVVRQWRCGTLCGLLIIAVFIAACSTSDSEYGTNADVSVEKATMLGRTLGGQGEYPGEQLGTGRVVQFGRKITAEFVVSDGMGREFGRERIRFYFLTDRTLSGLMQTGLVDEAIQGNLAGMRVGGRRHFVLPYTTCKDSAKRFCWLGDAGSTTHIEYPNSASVAFDVEVTDVCRPRIQIITESSFPKSEHTRAREVSCR